VVEVPMTTEPSFHFQGYKGRIEQVVNSTWRWQEITQAMAGPTGRM